MEVYYPMLKDTLEMFLFLGVELSILFILISAGVSLLQQYIPDTKIQAVLSGSKGRGYILAAIFGSITPFCSCSTIPMLRGLLRAKAGFGPTLTFLFTSPLLNPIIVGLFIATFGLKVTAVYVSIALIVSILASLVLDKMGFERYVVQEGEVSVATCCGTNNHQIDNTHASSPISAPVQSCASTPTTLSSCCESSPEPLQAVSSCCTAVPQQHVKSSCCSATEIAVSVKFSQKIGRALGDGWMQFKQVFPYLFLGILLGSFVYGFVPSDFIAKYASGDSLFAVPVAAVIGIPLYVRVEALIPLSVALVGKGMGLGAVMALIIGGGASLTEVILLKSMFRTPMIIAFLTVILFMAILAGYLFQFVL